MLHRDISRVINIQSINSRDSLYINYINCCNAVYRNVIEFRGNFGHIHFNNFCVLRVRWRYSKRKIHAQTNDDRWSDFQRPLHDFVSYDIIEIQRNSSGINIENSE